MVTDTSNETLLHCLQLSAPGPHVFLLVIPVGRFTQEERDTGKKLYMFSIVLFTFKDRLKNTFIEKFIISAGDNLQQLVQKCGGRYHAFNNENPGNEDQVGPLLVQIDKLVAANGGIWYTQVNDTEEFEGRLDQQHLGDRKNYEATFKVHEMKLGVNKGERRKDSENMVFEENLRRREEWIWRQEEQLWKWEERLRAEAERKDMQTK
ncbi:GTPase IMAP family member 4-like [Pygocentrus nattereri]|uniref:GTPase IMAP family member 4-like n=1 Tax=Pygocentrus nattereri TaxID=42514 RepID=UPI001890C14E|nr:GTPase IMAP family member 4-like [Pygocentrus nattereri]